MSAGAPRVIVIDDDPSVRTSMVRLLRTAGYEVEALGSARAFLERPPTAVPACLVLDVRLPALTGLELQGLLASTGRGPAIVFITGHPDVPASVSAMKGGAVRLSHQAGARAGPAGGHRPGSGAVGPGAPGPGRCR